MKRNAKLTFTKKADRPCLTLEESRYWKRLLSSILKMGFEHEFNLKESSGTCDGTGFVCPCNHPNKEETMCYAKCVMQSSCKEHKNSNCPGVFCVDFASPCHTCTEAVRDCTRCDLFSDPNKKPEKARRRIRDKLQPTNNLLRLGQHGTLQVVKDGSLLGGGGVEITTVGRRISYESFYKQANTIIEGSTEEGAYTNERASVHMHLVAGYFKIGTEGGKPIALYSKGGDNTPNMTDLEKPLPEIVLANFHQLLRRYHNALVWISSAGEEEDKLTRWAKFRKPVLKYSAIRHPMDTVIGQIAEEDGYKGRYSIANYSNMGFRGRNLITKLHIEMRHCDGILSPSAVAALGILVYAMFLTSVSLSQHGILHSGDNDYMKEAKEIQATLLNNDGSWSGPRFSDTSRFAPYREIVRAQSLELINLLRFELKKHGPTINILKKLADNPCSMRLIRGDSWSKIEADLKDSDNLDNKIAVSILRAIDTYYIEECLSREEWAQTLCEDEGMATDDVLEITDKLISSNVIYWDNIAGSFVRC